MKIGSKLTVAGAAALAMAVGSAAFAGTAAQQSAASGSSMKAVQAATPSKPMAPKPAASMPNKKTTWTKFTHAQVMTVQNALTGKGYTVKADGIWGKKTRAALKDFQKKNGLKATGHPDAKTLAALGVTL